jgi:hypothetical protein
MISSSGMWFTTRALCLAWFVAQPSTLKDKWGSWLLVVGGFLPGKWSKLPADNYKDYI